MTPLTTRSGNTLLWCPTTDRMVIREEATGDTISLPPETTRQEALEMLDAPAPSLDRRFRGKAR